MSHPEGDTEEDWQLGDSHIYTCARVRARACRSQSLPSFYKSVYVPLLYTLFLDAYDNSFLGVSMLDSPVFAGLFLGVYWFVFCVDAVL